jgi:hypothetical protein
MPSLIDIFNPSFLIFLGIMVLVVALLVVYFESKMREQNHKISSMLSLVSAMAEEVNIIRSNASISSLGGSSHTNKVPFEFNPQINISENTEDNKSLLFSENKHELIAVSDDETASESGSDSDSEDDEEDDDDYEDESSVDSNFIQLLQENQTIYIHDEAQDIKVLKINIENFDKDIAGITEEFSEDNDNNDLQDVTDVFSDSDNEIEDIDMLSGNNIIIIDGVNDLNEIDDHCEIDDHDEGGDLDDLNENDDVNGINQIDNNNITISQELPSDLDLKSINISDLEEIKNNNENVDYKKLPLNKLRSVVLEKNLTVDSSKLKKPELLKLLGAE